MLSVKDEPYRKTAHTLQIEVITRTLPAADIAIGDEPANLYLGVGAYKAAIIERKYSLGELQTNVFDRKRRPAFVRCLKAMSENFDRPTLLLEGTLGRLYASTHREDDAGLVMDATMRLCYEHGVALQIAEGNTQAKRRIIAEHAIRLLINGAYGYGRSPRKPD